MTDDRNRDPNLEDTQALDDELARDRERAGATGRSGRSGAGAPAERTRSRAFAIDPSLRIRDRWSEVFVIGTVLVFVGIFLFALAYGKGGAFTPERTHPPAASTSPAPSGSPAGSQPASAVPSGSPAASAGASPAASVEPTAAPTAAPSGSPAPATPGAS